MPGEALIEFFDASRDAAAPLARRDAALPLERRREPRTPANWIAMIHLTDGAEIPCTVKDVSKSGARLAVSQSAELPEAFLLRVVGYAFLLHVRLVWRSHHSAGVSIERFEKRPPSSTAPQEKDSAELAETDKLIGRRYSRYAKF